MVEASGVPPHKVSAVRRWLKRIGVGLFLLVTLILGVSVLTNILLPSRAGVPEKLSAIEKARVEESLHLRRVLGDSLWVGWSGARIPVIVYNESFAFLLGDDDPAPGWRTVPWDRLQGSVWEPVPDDSFAGHPYYRQHLPEGGPSPQAFTVRVGDAWVASMTIKDWMPIKMGNEIRDALPTALRLFVPYRLAGLLFAGVTNTDWYVCALGHESFHAFQGMIAPERLALGEKALSRYGDRYPWNGEGSDGAWKAEIKALADALSAKDKGWAIELCRKFISLRHARRVSAGLDSSLVELEKVREWEEGLAKYTELALWKLASSQPGYEALPVLKGDSDFEQFKGFDKQWSRELSTLRFQTGSGETRFYYSGMAQAFLLDRLSPGWREGALRDGLYLEDFLRAAMKN